MHTVNISPTCPALAGAQQASSVDSSEGNVSQ